MMRLIHGWVRHGSCSTRADQTGRVHVHDRQVRSRRDMCLRQGTAGCVTVGSLSLAWEGSGSAGYSLTLSIDLRLCSPLPKPDPVLLPDDGLLGREAVLESLLPLKPLIGVGNSSKFLETRPVRQLGLVKLFFQFLSGRRL